MDKIVKYELDEVTLEVIYLDGEISYGKINEGSALTVEDLRELYDALQEVFDEPKKSFVPPPINPSPWVPPYQRGPLVTWNDSKTTGDPTNQAQSFAPQRDEASNRPPQTR